MSYNEKDLSGTVVALKSLGWSDQLIESYIAVSKNLVVENQYLQKLPTDLCFDFGATSLTEIDLTSMSPAGTNTLAVS